MVSVILNKYLLSISIFFKKTTPSLLFHSSVTGEFGVSFLPSLTCQTLLLSGTFTSDFALAHPDSTKYPSFDFLGLSTTICLLFLSMLSL